MWMRHRLRLWKVNYDGVFFNLTCLENELNWVKPQYGSFPDPEMKVETTIKVAPEGENGSFSATQDEKGLRCMNNYEDTTFNMETLLDQHTEAADVEVNITECVNTNEIRLAQTEDSDATEYSSSFGDTISGAEDGSRLSDAEVESRFCGDNGPASIFDGFDSVFRTRKKKLTAHWRRYIQPLMWRCKWLELRVKEFQSQELKYDRELAAYEQRKQLESEQFSLEGSCMRSLPFSRQYQRRKAMKRRKRKRVEDTVDIPSYMSRHSLFSYYENKRSDADGASLDDDCGKQGAVIAADPNTNGTDEFGVNYEWPVLEVRNGDKPLEQFLWKIEVMQSRVHKLQAQLDKLISTNAGKFSSMENLSMLVPYDVPTSSARSPTFSTGNGDTMQVGALYTPPHLVSEYDIGDLVVPLSAVSSYGEETPLPDITESTMGRLSSANVTQDQLHIGDSCEDIADDILIHNQAAQEELHNFEKLNSQPIEKPSEPETEQENDSTIPQVAALEPDLAQKTIVAQEQLTMNAASEFHVPKNKRKRGERKAGSGGWSCRSSGEPDLF